MRMLTASLLVGLVAGCASDQTTQQPTTPDPAAPPAPAAESLGELKFKDSRGKVHMTLTTDGVLQKADGTEIAKLALQGDQIVVTMKDKTAATLGTDGKITGPDGKVMGEVTISAEGELSYKDKLVKIEADGTLAGGNPDAPKVMIEGATSAAKKRAAMVVFFMSMATGDVSTSPAPAAPAAP